MAPVFSEPVSRVATVRERDGVNLCSFKGHLGHPPCRSRAPGGVPVGAEDRRLRCPGGDLVAVRCRQGDTRWAGGGYWHAGLRGRSLHGQGVDSPFDDDQVVTAPAAVPARAIEQGAFVVDRSPGRVEVLGPNATANVAPDEADHPVPCSPHRQDNAMGEEVFDPSVGVPAHQAGVDRLVIIEAVAAEVLDEAGARPRGVPGQRSPLTGLQRRDVDRPLG